MSTRTARKHAVGHGTAEPTLCLRRAVITLSLFRIGLFLEAFRHVPNLESPGIP